ncbi:carbohydrate porin, partial [Acinetobacter variabilis]|uniref:carbohydrate porin n=3 Tax=Acinetobacter TaxID=469 RepID=UPI003D767C35
VSDMQNIGLVYKGAMDARPQDEIALGVARINMNNDVLGNRSEEVDAEIYYGIHATNWLTIRPNLQYVHHVGAYKDGENVWVGGIKFNTSF